MALGSPWQVAFVPGTHTSSKAWKEWTCTVPVQVSVEMCKIKPCFAASVNYSRQEMWRSLFICHCIPDPGWAREFKL